MNKYMVNIVFLFAQLTVCADIVVSDVQVFSGYPWKEVAIGYTIFGKAEDNQWLRVTAKDSETGKTYDCIALDGLTVRPMKREKSRLTEGRHIMIWNAVADAAKFKSDKVVFTLEITDDPPLYCAIDLSGGATAKSYEVEEIVDVQRTGWADEYKTTKLPLRRIEAGSNGGTKINTPFFIGVFEVTQKQYELVTGGKDLNRHNIATSYFIGDKFPADNVCYNNICGAYFSNPTWPFDNVKTCFLAKLRARTGVDFNLPTVAQWEYACRAGTTTTYSYGEKADGEYMWYSGNSEGSVHDVGTRLPNGWGLYDMHGNVWEWCLDASKSLVDGRILCGGDQQSVSKSCTSSSLLHRMPYEPGYYYNATMDWCYYGGSTGFRLVMPPPLQ